MKSFKELGLNENIINDISDLYKIKKEDIVSLERMGEKSATNLINAINKSKENGYDLTPYLGKLAEAYSFF